MERLFYYGVYPPIFAFGVITHIVFFKNVEIDVYIPHLVAGTLLAFCGLTSAYLLNGLSASATLYAVLVQSACFCLGVWTSMIIYRLAFHRIRSFPGPVLAKTTRFYNLYLSSKRVQYHRELEKIHKKYGDVVRTGKDDAFHHDQEERMQITDIHRTPRDFDIEEGGRATYIRTPEPVRQRNMV
jgi:hypothetical protein